MKKLLTILAVITLSGCIDARGYALQDQFCSDKGGVFEYVGDTAGFTPGWCKDNTKFTYDTVRNIHLQSEFYPERGE